MATTLTTTLNSTYVVGGARTGWSGTWGNFFRFPNNDTNPGTTRQAGGYTSGSTTYFYATSFIFNSSSLDSLRSRTITSVKLKFSSLSGSVPSSGNKFDVRYKLTSGNGLSSSSGNDSWSSSSGPTSTTAGDAVAKNFITSNYDSTNKTITLPNTLPNYGYVIGPHTYTSTGSQYAVGLYFGATAELIVQYNAYEYTISYNKGTYGTGTNTTATKIENTALTLKNAIFTRAGYVQTGWSTNSDGSTKDYNLGGSYTTNAAITLYPYWTPNTLTIQYHANGGTMASEHGEGYAIDSSGYVTKNGSRAIQTINYDSSDDPFNYNNPSVINLIKTNYKIEVGTEWNTSSDGTGTSFNQATSYTAQAYSPSLDSGDQTVTLYANWVLAQFPITYDAVGGTGAPATQYKTPGVDIQLSSTIPTKTGFTFLGWDDSSAAATVDYSPGETYTTDANLDLYAVWKTAGLWVMGSNSQLKAVPIYVMKQGGLVECQIYIMDSNGHLKRV